MLALLFACGTKESAILFEIHGDVSEGLSGFVFVISDEDGSVQRISCPRDGAIESAFGRIECLEHGVRIANAPADFDVTVKARGYEFANQSFVRADLGETERRAEITLSRLDAFEQNDDWSSGFGSQEGLEAFLAESYAVQTELGPTHVVKFYIHDLGLETQKIYFQNTSKHRLHHEFVRNVLGIPISLSEFESSTYHGLDRKAMAGTLVYYSGLHAKNASLGGDIDSPIALTFFPSDDLTPEQVVQAHQLLEARMGFSPLDGGTHRLAYLPAGTNQEADLELAPQLLARRDVTWTTRLELYGNQSLQILNGGLAFGTLRRASPEELETTVVSFADILILSRLPNSLPIVGGTITEELQTPLAHVNVASRSRGTPNIALLEAVNDERVAPFLNKLVRFEVKDNGFEIREATLEEATAFWDSRVVEPSNLEFDVDTAGLPGYAELGFADAKLVGSKAANLAELSHLLGDKAPKGFGVPFYYYDQFMNSKNATEALCLEAKADCVEEGRAQAICDAAGAWCDEARGSVASLQEYVARLVSDDALKLNSALREAVLDGLRYHIRHIPIDSDVATLLDQRVEGIFGTAKARLRSSTNAEDLPNFSGAGLYSSVSAYASGEKQASLQIRKVWASAWNWRAYEERSFWKIAHLDVRMGVNVNQAFPDEAANGVLITQNIADPLVAGHYVNVQLGEVPVTNPTDGSLPEVFSIIPGTSSAIQVTRSRYSSLSPDEPILSSAEVIDLFLASRSVQEHFAPLYGQSPNSLRLDLEFKFHGPERALFIKQVRPYLQAP